MSPYPKVVTLGIEWVIFSGSIDKDKWGKGHGARPKIADNIHRVSDTEIQDRTNSHLKCHLYHDIPRIVSDILKHGAKLAIVSRNTSKALTDRALYYMMVKDQHGKERRLIDLVNYNESDGTESKVHHFEKMHGYDNAAYMDMILYDHDKLSSILEMLKGVTFQHCPNGLTWDLYQTGLSVWRGTKAIHSPWHGLHLTSYPNRKLIGYSGMDIGSIELLEKGGRRHDRTEPSRWGLAMYVTDNSLVAKYFSDWIKKKSFAGHKTIVCEIYARDGAVWDKMHKIWVPDNRHELKTHVDQGDEHIADSDLKRDGAVAKWGVSRPYVLFCRHPNMNTRDGLQFPIPEPERFNEMVVYGQTQESLLVIKRMNDEQLSQAIKKKANVHYRHKIREWNIKVPEETKADFAKHNEKVDF